MSPDSTSAPSPGGTLNSFSRALLQPEVPWSRRECTRLAMLSTGTPVLPQSKPSRSASYRKLYCSCGRTRLSCTVWSQSRRSPGAPDHQLSSNSARSQPGSSFTFLLRIPEARHFSLQAALLWDTASNSSYPDQIFLKCNAPSQTRPLLWRRQPRKPVDYLDLVQEAGWSSPTVVPSQDTAAQELPGGQIS